MAVKKKSPQSKRVVTKKSKPAPKKRSRPAARPLSMAAPTEPQAVQGGMNFTPLIILILVFAGLYFYFHKNETPQAHKASADIQISATPIPAATEAPAALLAPTPQKRATSPAGPRVWNRQKTKSPARFYIVREKDAIAEVMIFKAGNLPVITLRSEKGPRKTVQINWDGKDSHGQLVAAGVYYARISGAHGDLVEEILIK